MTLLVSVLVTGLVVGAAVVADVTIGEVLGGVSDSRGVSCDGGEVAILYFYVCWSHVGRLMGLKTKRGEGASPLNEFENYLDVT